MHNIGNQFVCVETLQHRRKAQQEVVSNILDDLAITSSASAVHEGGCRAAARRRRANKCFYYIALCTFIETRGNHSCDCLLFMEFRSLNTNNLVLLSDTFRK